MASSRAGSGRITEELLAQLLEENEELGYKLHVQSSTALQTKEGKPLEGTRYVSVVDNIAVIQLVGPIYPRANMMTCSGATSLQQFMKDFLTAFNNDEIEGIVIDADSPGGDVRGIGDAAEIIYQARQSGVKPINTFANGYFCSACYYVGSAAKKIYGSKSSINGSIGVVLTARRKGDDEIEVVSSISPDKRPDASTDEGRAVLQRQVDDLAEVFAKDVQKYRGISREFLLDNYGRGGVEIGAKAQRLGLIDSVSNLGEVIEITAKEAENASGSRAKGAAAAQAPVAILKFTDEDKIFMGLQDLHKKFGAVTNDPAAQQEKSPANESNPKAGLVDSEGEGGGNDAGHQVRRLTAEELAARRLELGEQYSDSAELFAERLITAHRIYPAEQVYAAASFLIAKTDDALFGGSVQFINSEGELVEGTREEAVRAAYNSRPTHSLTQQAVAGIKSGDIKVNVLNEQKQDKATEPVVMTEERRTELLASSDQGRAVLDNNQNGARK